MWRHGLSLNCAKYTQRMYQVCSAWWLWHAILMFSSYQLSNRSDWRRSRAGRATTLAGRCGWDHSQGRQFTALQSTASGARQSYGMRLWNWRGWLKVRTTYVVTDIVTTSCGAISLMLTAIKESESVFFRYCVSKWIVVVRKNVYVVMTQYCCEIGR